MSSSFDSLYYYDRAFRILICRSCQYAVLPNQFTEHNRKRHPHLKAEPSLLSSLQSTFEERNLELHPSMKDVTLPTEPIPAYGSLASQKGYICTIRPTCLYILTGANAQHNMEGHQSKSHRAEVLADDQKHEHLWASVGKVRKGRPTKSETELIRQRRERRMRPVLAQRFFPSIGRGVEIGAAAYFEVTPPPSSQRQSTSACDRTLGYDSDTHEPTTTDSEENGDLQYREDSTPSKILTGNALRDLLALGNDKRQSHLTSSTQLILQQEANQANPYLELTGWQKKLQGFDFNEIESLYAPPTAQDGFSAVLLWLSIKTMLRTWQYNTDTRSRMECIAVLRDTVGRPPSAPFSAYYQHDTKHGISLQNIFMFFYRTQNTKIRFPSYQFSQPQSLAFNALTQYLIEASTSHSRDISTWRQVLDTNPTRITLHPLERLCHNFWLTLIRQEVYASEDELSLLTALSTLAITSNGYKQGSTIATDLSALKKMARFAFLQELSHEYPATSCTSQHLLIDMSSTTSKGPLSTLQGWTDQFLTLTSRNAIQWISAIGIEIRSIQKGIEREGTIHWDGSRISHLHITLDTEDWKEMVQKHYQETLLKLLPLLYVTDITHIPLIPWDEIYDRPGLGEVGYHVFTTEANPSLSRNCDFIIRQIQLQSTISPTPKALQKLINLDKHQRLDTISAYSKQVQTFLTHLAVLVHLTYGQTARVTELLSVRYKNTSNTLRNVAILQGLIAIIPRWNKKYNQTKQPSPIWRFTPRAVSDLIGWYLWLVLPYFQSLQQLVPLSSQSGAFKRAYSAFLFPKEDGEGYYSDTDVFTRTLKAITNRHLGQPIGPRPLRQLTVGMGREDADSHEQFTIMNDWEVHTAAEEQDEDALELQSGHSVTTGHLVYANLMFAHSSRLRERYWKVSSRWHRYLKFELTKRQTMTIGPLGTKEKLTEPTPVEVARARRARGLTTVNHMALLQKMYGRASQFRGLQEQVLADIFTDKSPVVYIAGTGSGKSLAFLLPAMCPTFGMQIVVVPLISICTNIMLECKALGIHCVPWGSEAQVQQARIVIVLPEQLTAPGFASFVSKQRQLAAIGRIVIDEAHYVLLTGTNFREQMYNLCELVKWEVPITALTATLPPTREEELFSTLRLPHHQESGFHRESTSQVNIRYEVERIAGEKKTFGTREIADHIKQRKTEGGYRKIVVFVPFRNLVESVATELGCYSYHGSMTEQEKGENLRGFMNATDSIIIATIAADHGLHDPTIDAIFHYGQPQGPIPHVQMAGRAGRHGKVGVARVILAAGLKDFAHKADAGERFTMEQFLGTQGECRRRALDLYMDGATDRVRCRENEAHCDNCAANMVIDPTLMRGTVPTHTSLETAVTVYVSSDEESDDEYGEFPLGIVEGETQGDELTNPTPIAASPTSPSHKRKRAVSIPPSARAMPRIQVGATPETVPPTHTPTNSSVQQDASPRVPATLLETASPSSSSLPTWTPVTTAQSSPNASQHSRLTGQQSPIHASPATPSAARYATELREARKKAQARDKEAANFLYARIEVVFTFWEENCIRCYTNKEQEGVGYDHPACEEIYIQREIRDLVKSMTLPKFVHCSACLLPMTVCRRYKDKKEACVFGGAWVPQTVLGLVISRKEYHHHDRDRGFFAEQMGQKNKNVNTEVGSSDFNRYYSMRERMCQEMIPNVVKDVVLWTEAYFLNNGDEGAGRSGE